MRIYWDEPAYDRDGVVISRQCSMTCEDAARMMRLLHPDIYENDQQALDDFIAVHWAWQQP